MTRDEILALPPAARAMHVAETVMEWQRVAGVAIGAGASAQVGPAWLVERGTAPASRADGTEASAPVLEALVALPDFALPERSLEVAAAMRRRGWALHLAADGAASFVQEGIEPRPVTCGQVGESIVCAALLALQPAEAPTDPVRVR